MSIPVILIPVNRPVDVIHSEGSRKTGNDVSEAKWTETSCSSCSPYPSFFLIFSCLHPLIFDEFDEALSYAVKRREWMQSGLVCMGLWYDGLFFYVDH